MRLNTWLICSWFLPRRCCSIPGLLLSGAHDIRNQYTIGYRPSTPQSQGGYRTIKVEAHSTGHKRLMVRTRSGYYPGPQRASN